MKSRLDCQYRHENGNCLKVGGFCTSIDDKYCPMCGVKMVEPTCDTCEYNTASFMPCNVCEDKSEYEPQEGVNE